MSARLFYKAKTLYLCWSGMKRGFTEIEVRGSKYIYSLIKHKYITNLRESKINEISIEIANFRGLGGELSSLIAKKYFFIICNFIKMTMVTDSGDSRDEISFTPGTEVNVTNPLSGELTSVCF